ncbi:MAG TPA: hypothetical protein VKM94_20975 [Blastocatellia bacterium]|nr:hypothetical protein [Blastocatellia bacterium]
MISDLSRRSLLRFVLPAAAAVAFMLPRRAKAAVDQPHMHAALEALRSAAKELEAASQDKGGHRAKALNHVHQAIDECERGIKFERRH